MRSKMMLACLIVGGLLPASSANAQDGTLGINLTLESTRVWRAHSAAVLFVAEFRNQANEPLRWHPQITPFTMPCVLYLQRADGTRYLASGNLEAAEISRNSVEITEVLPVGTSSLSGGMLGTVSEADDEGWLPKYVDAIDNDGDPVRRKSYEGLLPVGEYDVWIAFSEGPPLNEVQPERSPQPGVYSSNHVHLSVVPDGTPTVSSLRLQQSIGRTAAVVNHRGIGMIRADALAASGITTEMTNDTVTLRYGRKEVVLALRKTANLSTTRAPLPAVSLGPTFLVPLRSVASGLAMDLHFQRDARIFTLRQRKPGVREGEGGCMDRREKYSSHLVR